MDTQDLYANLTEQYQPLMEPLAKLNKLAVADLEKLVSFQMSTMASYLNLGMEELKSATEVTDLQGLQRFYQRQLELGTVLQKKMVDDANALFELATGFETELAQMATEYSPAKLAAETMPAMMPQNTAF